MYAIVDIEGQQFMVEKGRKIYVHRLEANEGSQVSFERILLVDNEGKIEIGTPVVSNFYVSAMVISHLKGDKVKVFKKKNRKGYQKLNNHRQQFTEILIEGILEGKVPAKKEALTATEKKATASEEVKKQTTEKPKTAAIKSATEKKVTATKKVPVAKKPAVVSKSATTKKTAAIKPKTTAKKTTGSSAKKEQSKK